MKLSAITDGKILTLFCEEFILQQVELKHGSVFSCVIGEKRYEILIESHHNGKLLSQPLLYFYPINEIKPLKVSYKKHGN